MTDRKLYQFITTSPLSSVLERYPLTADFFANMRFDIGSGEITLGDMLKDADQTVMEEFGILPEEIPFQLMEFILALSQNEDRKQTVESLTILGGFDKSGRAEEVTITLRRGEVAAIVGPTGSGKSRLLGDIECLAQRDTPTGRMILIDGGELSDERRFEMDGKLVAQLSQNMNFVMDLTVREFLEMHARSRLSRDVENTIALCTSCANDLAGERFWADTKVTQLSGGQSRALMIADTAFMSSSPLVLIDEIENAGIDRKKAIRVLTKEDKIVLIATHDPLLALSADRRIVIKNGGIAKVFETSAAEKNILADIEKIDNITQKLRNSLRAGEEISAFALSAGLSGSIPQ